MKECPRCRVVNPDISEQCDCGYSFLLQYGGSSPVPMSARTVPVVVKVHAVLVGIVLVWNAWARIAARSWITRSHGRDELVGLGIVAVVAAVLFFLMLGGRAWARVALGVLTLPAGLLILWPHAAREFTDPHYSADPVTARRVLN